jgi:hypothetical protein
LASSFSLIDNTYACTNCPNEPCNLIEIQTYLAGYTGDEKPADIEELEQEEEEDYVHNDESKEEDPIEIEIIPKDDTFKF